MRCLAHRDNGEVFSSNLRNVTNPARVRRLFPAHAMEAFLEFIGEAGIRSQWEADQRMWKAIQDFLGPVPAPVFILVFIAGLTISVVASAPTKWVERGLQALARRRNRRASNPPPTGKR